MGNIVRNYLYTAAYQILILIAPIVTAPYLARVLGADNLGIYGYVNSSGNIITTISLLGIYAYGNRQTAYVRENKDELNKTFWELSLDRVILGLIGTTLYILYAALNKEYSLYIFFYYPYILAQFIDCSWLFIGLEDMKPAVMKNTITKLVNIAGIVIFVKSKDDLGIYFGLLSITTLIANVSMYPQLKKYIHRPQFEIRRLINHIRGSFVLFLPQVASLFYLQVDKVMLKWLTGAVNQVSFYEQAEKIVTIPLSLITVVSTVMMPRLANEYKKKNYSTIRELLLKAGRYTLCMAMPMSFGIACIAQKFVPWYLGTEFYPTAVAMIILSPIVLLNSLSGISGKQYFTATNQISILMKAYSSAAIMNVIVNALLIPYLGFKGAAIATVLSSLASVIVQYINLGRQVNVYPFLSWGLDYLIGGLCMAVVITLMGLRFEARSLVTFCQITVGVLVYLMYLYLRKDAVLKEIIEIAVKRIHRL